MPDLAELHPRLSRLIPRLASDQDGEVLATVRALRKVLDKAGLDLHDLAAALPVAPPTPDDWRAAVRFVSQHMEALSPGEAAFIGNVRRFSRISPTWEPSPRQAAWLEAIRSDLAGEMRYA